MHEKYEKQGTVLFKTVHMVCLPKDTITVKYIGTETIAAKFVEYL